MKIRQPSKTIEQTRLLISGFCNSVQDPPFIQTTPQYGYIQTWTLQPVNMLVLWCCFTDTASFICPLLHGTHTKNRIRTYFPCFSEKYMLQEKLVSKTTHFSKPWQSICAIFMINTYSLISKCLLQKLHHQRNCTLVERNGTNYSRWATRMTCNLSSLFFLCFGGFLFIRYFIWSFSFLALKLHIRNYFVKWKQGLFQKPLAEKALRNILDAS